MRGADSARRGDGNEGGTGVHPAFNRRAGKGGFGRLLGGAYLQVKGRSASVSECNGKVLCLPGVSKVGVRSS